MREFYGKNPDLRRELREVKKIEDAQEKWAIVKAAEKALPGAALRHPAVIQEIEAAVNLQDFVLTQSRQVFVTLVILHNQGLAVTVENIVKECSRVYMTDLDKLRGRIDECLDIPPLGSGPC